MLYQLSYLAAAVKCSAVQCPRDAAHGPPAEVGSALDTAVTRPVSIIGAPLDLGQSRRGVDMGPSAIRYAGLEERLTAIGLVVSDRGNVVAPEPEALAAVDERARYLPEILDACADLRRSSRSRCERARARSCSVAITRSRWERSPVSRLLPGSPAA